MRIRMLCGNCRGRRGSEVGELLVLRWFYGFGCFTIPSLHSFLPTMEHSLLAIFWFLDLWILVIPPLLRRWILGSTWTYFHMRQLEISIHNYDGYFKNNISRTYCI